MACAQFGLRCRGRLNLDNFRDRQGLRNRASRSSESVITMLRNKRPRWPEYAPTTSIESCKWSPPEKAAHHSEARRALDISGDKNVAPQSPRIALWASTDRADLARISKMVRPWSVPAQRWPGAVQRESTGSVGRSDPGLQERAPSTNGGTGQHLSTMTRTISM